MENKILIINGHPKNNSFNYAIAEAYKNGAETKNVEVRQLNIVELKFKPFMEGFDKDIKPEPDIIKAQEQILWAEHLVWIYPFQLPTLLQAFLHWPLKGHLV